MRKFLAALVAAVTMASVADACHRHRTKTKVTVKAAVAPATPAPAPTFPQPMPGPKAPEKTPAPKATPPAKTSAADALDEVNRLRAARGLAPYVRDESLTAAALACASARAERRLFGHTENDFAFLPRGSTALATGCAAYHASYGWMSCAVYDRYTFAGAAFVTGADGKRYMHLFVR